MSYCFLHRYNKESGVLEKNIYGSFGPFENTFDVAKYYAKEVLSWDDGKIDFTENYFRQISKDLKGYYDFLVDSNHIFIFYSEPKLHDIEIIQKKINEISP